MRRDVGQPEIAREKGINQEAGSDGDEKPYGVDSAFSADGKEGVLLKLAYHRRDHRVNSETEGEQN